MMRPLLLSGFMATGKSSVGRLLAEKRGAMFIDLDVEIEAEAGQSIESIFQTSGEARFRELEAKVLRRVISAPRGALVVALGGGALLSRPLRVDVLSQAVVVTLTASSAEILRRAEVQQGARAARPLLEGADRLGRIEQLLSQRRLAYREAHAEISTEGRSLPEIAEEAARIWDEDAICVAAGEETYRVLIGSGLIKARLSDFVGTPSGTLLVTDANVNPLHGDKARSVLSSKKGARAEVVLTPGEEHKSLTGLSQIFEAAFESGIDRKATFIGLGGGVVTDMTGFAAATWVRGVRWIGCPTTLLSMVDASVGGKTAVDFHTAKNSVGAFWQPAGVICDVETLKTETDRMFVGALSEVVKTALIGDPELLTYLEENAERLLVRDPEVTTQVVERCVRVKARIVALDERETGIRATLNLGHTIGHALESAGGYTGLTHGEAVSLGLVAALRFGERKGHTPSELSRRVLELLQLLKLPHRLGADDLQKSSSLISHDKKRAGDHIRFVYARAPGDVFTENIGISELVAALPSLAS
jgi:shikimate kinase/3-dehydroquinate synthase